MGKEEMLKRGEKYFHAFDKSVCEWSRCMILISSYRKWSLLASLPKERRNLSFIPFARERKRKKTKSDRRENLLNTISFNAN
jgi:hypothetical protein